MVAGFSTLPYARILIQKFIAHLDVCCIADGGPNSRVSKSAEPPRIGASSAAGGMRGSFDKIYWGGGICS
jgi:hypothetical protein